MSVIRTWACGPVQLHRLLLVLVAVSCLFAPLGAAAQGPSATATSPVPVVIPLTGVVKPSSDARAVSAEVTLSLYIERDDPTAAWVETQTVALDADGRYSVQFGATRPEGLPAALFAAAAARWVGVAVDGEPEGPRMMLLSVAYAANAAVAHSLGGRTAADFVLAGNLAGAVRDALSRAPRSSASASEGDVPMLGTMAVDGSGTANAIVKFLNSTGTIGDSAITESGGKVGIGTANPQSTLEIQGVNARTELKSTTGANAAFSFFTNGGGSAVVGVENSLGANIFTTGGLPYALAVLAPGTTNAVQIGANGTARVTVLPGGNVGIGTTNPQSTLDIFSASARTEIKSTTGTNAAFAYFTNAAGSGVVGVDNNLGGNIFSSGGLPYALALLAPGTAHPVQIGTNGLARMTVLADGNVGIGTTTPTARLEVAGDIVVDGNISAKYQDVAEWVESAEPLESGTLVVIDRATTNRVSAASRAYDSRVAGAISAQPGVVLGQGGPGRELVAQSGRVRIKADARYGAIRPGDLLVSSPTKGHAMRSRPIEVAGQSLHRPGTLIGKALEALPAGRGEILVLLTLQ